MTNTLTNGLGRRLRQARQRAGMSQAELCEVAGLSNSFLSDIETEKRGLSIENAVAFSRAVGVDLDWLATGGLSGPPLSPRQTIAGAVESGAISAALVGLLGAEAANLASTVLQRYCHQGRKQ